MISMNHQRILWLDPFATPPEDLRGGAVAIGNFDGVHRGHAELVRLLRSSARPAVVVSFDPHPLRLLAPERFQPELTTPSDRGQTLCDIGADGVCFLRTDAELLHLSAEAFFRQILVERFRARVIVEGFNFRFGRDRQGDVNLLRRLCEQGGIGFRVVAPIEWKGRPVSSSRVRWALESGDVAEARELLGRPYRIQGVVGQGAKRGRQLGFPTANLEQISTLIPAEGVYAVQFDGADERLWGAAHIGPVPTFHDLVRRVEVHLLDFAGDLYGRVLTVAFVQRLRPIQTFADAHSLTSQLRHDIDAVRRIAQESNP
jgi:riboflavin kinase/FMN adenylyltransferase